MAVFLFVTIFVTIIIRLWLVILANSLRIRVACRLPISNTCEPIPMFRCESTGRPNLVNERGLICWISFRPAYFRADPQKRMTPAFAWRALFRTIAMQICGCPRFRISEFAEK